MEKQAVINIYNHAATRYETLIEEHFDNFWEDIIPKLDISQNYRVLDLGCGTGRTIRRMMNNHKEHAIHFTGVDLCPEMISEAKKRIFEKETNGHQILLHAEDCLDYLKSCEENKYHLVIASFLLAYVEAAKLFPLVNRVLKRGGRFIILTTSGDFLIRNYEKEFYKFAALNIFNFDLWGLLTKKLSRVPSTERIERLLFDSGFSKIEINKIEKNIFFDNIFDFMRWAEESGLATQYFNLAKRNKKEFLINKAIKYAEAKNMKYFGEPVKRGAPFKFTWPIYKIIAEKYAGKTSPPAA